MQAIINDEIIEKKKQNRNTLLSERESNTIININIYEETIQNHMKKFNN